VVGLPSPYSRWIIPVLKNGHYWVAVLSHPSPSHELWVYDDFSGEGPTHTYFAQSLGFTVVMVYQARRTQRKSAISILKSRLMRFKLSSAIPDRRLRSQSILIVRCKLYACVSARYQVVRQKRPVPKGKRLFIERRNMRSECPNKGNE